MKETLAILAAVLVVAGVIWGIIWGIGWYISRADAQDARHHARVFHNVNIACKGAGGTVDAKHQDTTWIVYCKDGTIRFVSDW